MIDFARITVKAGDGGNGVGSFTHIKGRRYGKADGGDGGDGGDVYLGTSADLNTLEPFRYVKDYRAERGKDGLSRRRRGAQGEDLVVKVPVGTVVKVGRLGKLSESANQNVSISDKLTGRPSDKPKNRHSESSEYSGIQHDLTQEGQRVLIASGGRGGRGNVKLRDEFGRRPKAGEPGQAGEIVKLELELKLIADVGLIGLPNAGKSTLLSTLTLARPKIAPYPFTTLEPNLGVLNSSQFTVHSSWTRQNSETSVNREPITVNQQAKLVIADIPGLIEGASQGKGLGDLFLRHIERTRVLVHLVDSSRLMVNSSQKYQKEKSVDTVNDELRTVNQLWQDYQTVRAELKAYSKGLAKKKEIIVLTKIDLVAKEKVDQVLRFFKDKRKKVVAISATGGQGLDLLIKTISKLDF